MLLEKITQTFGVSGREKPVVDLLIGELKAYADDIGVDALGSCTVTKYGRGERKKRVMIASHIDQIGFCVTGVDAKGFVRVRAVGGISAVTSHCGRVVFQNGVKGVMYSEESDWSKNDFEKLYIDIGAKDREDALSMISLGNMAAYEGSLVSLANGRYLSRAFDDRIGAYIMVESFKRLAQPYNDLFFSFSVQEEVGIRGTKVAAHRIAPDVGLAFDIGGAYDTPGCRIADMGQSELGKGAAVKIIDGHMISDERLNRFLISVAEENSIPYQIEVASGGGTDGAMIQLAQEGVPSTTISIPTRYGHSMSEMIDIHDVNACIDLCAAFCDGEIRLAT